MTPLMILLREPFAFAPRGGDDDAADDSSGALTGAEGTDDFGYSTGVAGQAHGGGIGPGGFDDLAGEVDAGVGHSGVTGAEHAYAQGRPVASYPEDDPDYLDPSRGTYTTHGQPTGTLGPGGSGGWGMTVGTLGFPAVISGPAMVGQAIAGQMNGAVGPTSTATGPGYGGSEEPGGLFAMHPASTAAPPPSNGLLSNGTLGAAQAGYQYPQTQLGPGWYNAPGRARPVYSPYSPLPGFTPYG